MSTFGATVSEWVAAEKERKTAVFRASVQEFVSRAQTTVNDGGHLPIDIGFLRASIIVSLDGPPVSRADAEPAKGTTYSYDGAEVNLVISGAELGQDIFGAWAAVYAKRMEYGFVGEDSLGRTYNQTGFGFVGKTAQQWQAIVEEQSAAAMASVQGSGQ